MATELDNARLNTAGLIVGSIVHDLGNPLNWAISASKALQNNLDDTEIVKDASADIDVALERIHTVVRAVKAIASGSEMDTEGIELSKLSTELSRFHNGCTAKIVYALNNEQIVKANKSGLILVLHNLIKNAFDARNDATVILSSEQVDGAVCLVVEDNGPGMSAEQVNKIFGNYSSNEGDDRIRGLGMQIVHELIVNMGGKISCNSQLGEGTKVTISLPSV